MNFSELVGKDLWVRAQSTLSYYIRIHDISQNGEMLFNRIFADLVDGYWELCESDVYNIEHMIAHPTWECNLCRSYASDWKITAPLELLSSEEILDFLYSYSIYADDEVDEE